MRLYEGKLYVANTGGYAFYNEITDYRTAEAVGVDRPQKNEILHNIPPTERKLDSVSSGERTRKSLNQIACDLGLRTAFKIL